MVLHPAALLPLTKPLVPRAVNVPKPRWLPDLGRPKRCAVLDEFFNISDGATRPTISREASSCRGAASTGVDLPTI